mmetsp:Transcript_44016/g.82268  ORF Transcript_44016/g.82268 Transcript_44016/m.82268 type:complete len:219 (+) Transcript_44016:100-756(+)
MSAYDKKSNSRAMKGYAASRWAPRAPRNSPPGLSAEPYYDHSMGYSDQHADAWAPPGLDYTDYMHDTVNYIDPRMPTGAEPDYLASCLNSLYYPGLHPMLPDLSDEWSHPMPNHLCGGWEQEVLPYDATYTAVAPQETPSEHGKEGSSCSTTDTDQVRGDFPTKGSAKHHLGLCKPCAFIYKTGCNTGWECEFCHLCEPGEKKRRKKERKQIRRTKGQ